MHKAFASCEWRYLSFFNYEVDPDWLTPHLPNGTELDFIDGKTYLSLVGLIFKHTKVLGMPLPTQQNYQQVNVRFYVRRKNRCGKWRKGVAFLRELTTKRGLALAARFLYNEPFVSVPVHRRVMAGDHGIHVEYSFKGGDRWSTFTAATASWDPRAPEKNSREEFFTHRLYSFTAQRDGSTLELGIHHPQWRIYPVRSAQLDLRTPDVLGPEIAQWMRGIPDHAVVAEGSKVRICGFKKLDLSSTQTPSGGGSPTHVSASGYRCGR